MLTLSLDKPGAKPAPKLQLALNKGASFKVTVAWKCDARHEDDVDIHALEARNDGGGGAKVTALEQILSTYNTTRMSPKTGVLVAAADGSFATPSGGLRHSGDIRVQVTLLGNAGGTVVTGLVAGSGVRVNETLSIAGAAADAAATGVRIKLLEMVHGTDVNGISFVSAFDTLDGVELTGVWNKVTSRVEF